MTAQPIPAAHLHGLLVTDAASSLSRSADLAETIGHHGLAKTYRDWAESARSMGMMGNQLYRHWAGEAAAKVASIMMDRREG